MTPEIMWGAAGALLIIADVVFGSFFMLFLGAGALITAALVWAGLLPDPAWQWIVFAAVSGAGVLAFRKKLLAWFGPDGKSKYTEHAGNRVEVLVTIPAQGNGKVKYRGTEWLASSKSGIEISEGQTAVITGNDGIVLEVEAV